VGAGPQGRAGVLQDQDLSPPTRRIQASQRNPLGTEKGSKVSRRRFLSPLKLLVWGSLGTGGGVGGGGRGVGEAKMT
jgi:hypothetical protein